MSRQNPSELSLLDHISTHWTMVEDPPKFVLRYAPAIREYIDNLLRGHFDVDDVAQDFILAVMSRGFSEKQVTRGRFRDYLRVAVRNAVMDYFRRRKPTTCNPDLLEDSLADVDEDPWVQSWRACIIEKAWRSLRSFEKANPGNRYHEILKLATDSPELSSAELASRLSSTGSPVRADTYRQQLHRARTKFAGFIVDEVRDTLRHRDPEELADELRDLGLDSFVRDYVEE